MDVLKRYPHLKWVSEADKGQSDAMNKGFELSSGEIIVYLNADDYFKPGAFEAVASEMSDASKFVVGQVEVLKPGGQGFLNDPKVELAQMLRWWQPNAYCYNSAGYFYDREIQEQVGGFSVEDHLTMDYEFLIKARQVTAFKNISKVLACFRLFPGTKTHENMKGIVGAATSRARALMHGALAFVQVLHLPGNPSGLSPLSITRGEGSFQPAC